MYICVVSSFWILEWSYYKHLSTDFQVNRSFYFSWIMRSCDDYVFNLMNYLSLPFFSSFSFFFFWLSWIYGAYFLAAILTSGRYFFTPITPGYVCIKWFFSWLWVILSCYFGCLVIFDWMLSIGCFMSLVAGLSFIPLNSSKLLSSTQDTLKQLMACF